MAKPIAKFVAVYRTLYFTTVEHNNKTCDYECTARFEIDGRTTQEARLSADRLLSHFSPLFPHNETYLEALFRVCPDKPKPRR